MSRPTFTIAHPDGTQLSWLPAWDTQKEAADYLAVRVAIFGDNHAWVRGLRVVELNPTPKVVPCSNHSHKVCQLLGGPCTFGNPVVYHA